MTDPTPSRPFRRWPIFVAPALFVALALGWSAYWFYAAGKVDAAIDGWRAREAQSGRIHGCNDRSVAGFPFRFEVRCSGANVTLMAQTAEQAQSMVPEVLRFAEIVVVAQVYTPNLLIAEFTAPATLAEANRPPLAIASWRDARASVAGPPDAPQQVSLIIDDATLEATDGTARVPLGQAGRFALHGRVAPGAALGQPAIETVLQTEAMTAPGVHPALAVPFNSEVRARLSGLRDFTPKPWPQRFREVQAAGGRIEITQARLTQGKMVATASGALGIAADGHLDGELELTVAGLEGIAAALGLDRLLGPVGSLVPGGLMAMLGKPATLDGRSAVAVPLVFADGAVRLGPLTVARTDPLF